MPARDAQIRDAVVAWLNDAANQANFPQTFTATGVWDTGYELEKLTDTAYHCQVFHIPTVEVEHVARQVTRTSFVIGIQFYKKYEPDSSGATRVQQGDNVAELRDVVRTYLEPNETNDTPPSMSNAYWDGMGLMT
jgi:hypothetical protein